MHAALADGFGSCAMLRISVGFKGACGAGVPPIEVWVPDARAEDRLC